MDITLSIRRQESYSRGELLLRSFFGIFYILIPHAIALTFVSLWGAILQFLTFWAVLFTGKYPRNWFDTQLGILNWNLRLNATLLNMADGYPAFGLSGEHPGIQLHIPYREDVPRYEAFVRGLLGGLVILPHAIILVFRANWVLFLNFLAWWAILFTGRFPQNWFTWCEEQMRWGTRLNAYLLYMTEEYPPFTGRATA